MYVDTIEGFVLDEIAKVNRLDFALVTFYPRFSASLSARNADPIADGVYVRGAVKARKELTNAPCKTVEPINKEAHDRPRIVALVDTETQSGEVIVPEHVIRIYGQNIPIVKGRSDEGIWLETRRRGKVATAEVLRSNAAEARCVFRGELAKSSYTLVVGTRCGKSTDYKVRRCLAEVRMM